MKFNDNSTKVLFVTKFFLIDQFYKNTKINSPVKMNY